MLGWILRIGAVCVCAVAIAVGNEVSAEGRSAAEF